MWAAMAFSNKISRYIQAWLNPHVPADIRSVLRETQSNDLNRHVSMLMAVAALNTIIIMSVCAHDGFPLYSYAWMSLLVLYCGVRIAMRSLRHARGSGPENSIRLSSIMGVSIIALLGFAASYSFAAGTFGREMLIPISLVCGTMAIAHCLYTLRTAAILVLFFGIFPVSVTMILTQDYKAIMMGFAFLSVGALMIRFIAAQSAQLIQNLLLQQQIHELANTDALTGLANRRAIMAQLEMLEESRAPFAVALLDLDGFKDVNDTLGHHVGDVLLQQVSLRLLVAAGETDLVGRLGGDEFIVILREARNATDIAAISNALLASLCQPVTIDQHITPIGASLGAALFPQDAVSIDALLKHADEALYSVKRQGKKTSVARRAA